MAHTFDAKVQYPAQGAGGSTANPLSLYLDCANDVTLVVLDINIAGGSARTGGAPSINGKALTIVGTPYICTEVTGEKWFGVFSHFAGMGIPTPTIPGSLGVSIPNAGGLTIWGAAHTYKAGAGKVSIFDVSTYKTGTTATANPSGTIFPTDAAGLVTVTAGFGANAVPTSSTLLINTLFSHDSGNYTFFQGYRLLSAVGSVRVNFTLGSDDWGWVLAAFKEADAPIIAVLNTRPCSSVLLNLPDSWTRQNWKTRPVTETMPLLGDSTFQQAAVGRNWTDGMTLSDSKGAWADRPREASDTLTLTDSLVLDYIHIILGEINERAATDTLDLDDSQAREVRLTRAITAWLMLSDDQRRTKGSWASIADAVGLTDLEEHWAERWLSKLDALFVYDGDLGVLWMRHEVPVLSVTDLSDAAQQQADRTITASDLALLLADATIREAARTASATDTIPLSDTTGSSRERSRFSLDDLVLSDSIVRDFLHIVLGEVHFWENKDTLYLTDAVERHAKLTGSVLDWLKLDDTVRRSWDARIAVTEGLNLTDTQQQTVERDLARLDALFVADLHTRELRLRRDAADAVILFYQTQRVANRTVTASDVALLLTDATLRNALRAVSAQDAAAVDDSVWGARDAARSALENLPVSDSLVQEYVKAIIAGIYEWAVTDTLPIMDAAVWQTRLERALFDWLALGDSARQSRSAWQAMLDALGVTDQNVRASGAVTLANMRLSLATDAAFVDFSAANLLTPYLVAKLTVLDSLGRKLIGYVKLPGASETYGGELLTNGTFASWVEDAPTWWTTEGEGGSNDLTESPSGRCRIVTETGTWLAISHADPLPDDGVCGRVVLDVTAREAGSIALDGYVIGARAWNAVGNAQARYFTSVAGQPFALSRGVAGQLNDLTIDNASLVQVLSPSATGVTITSTPNGVSQNWASEETGFNRNDPSGYTYEIEGVLRTVRTVERCLQRLDALFVFDQVARELRLRRNVVDAILLFDQEKHLRDLLQKITDALLLTDQEKHALSLSQVGTDALTLADLTAKHFPLRWRLVSDAIALLDVVQHRVDLSASLTDWLRLDDLVRWQGESVRRVTEAVELTDQEKHGLNRGMQQLDTLFVFDSITKQIAYRYAVSDAAPLFDSGVGAADRRLSVSDVMLLLSDSMIRDGVRRGRGALDSLTVTDASAQELRASRLVLEQIAISDALLREYVKAYVAGFAAVTDVLGVTDTVARETRMTRAVTEWAALDDFTRRQRSAWQSVADTTGLTDQERYWAERGLAKLDALFVYDAATRELRLRRGVADAVILFDQAQTERAVRVASTETTFLTDDAKRQFIRQARLDDVLPLSDSRASSVTRVITALDSLLVTDRVAQLTEAFRKIVDYLAPLADSVVAEGATGGRTYTVQAFDVLDVVDNSGRRAATTRSVMDALAVGDLAGAARALLRQVADALGIADERSAALVIQRAAVDWVLLSDSRARTWWSTEILTDRIGLSDTHAAARKLTLFETLALSDVTSAEYVKAVFGILIERSVTDVLALADETAPTRYATRQIQDALGVSDTSARRLTAIRFVLDVLGLDDSVTRTLEHFLVGQVIVRAITDTLDVLDLLQIERQFHVAVADTTATVDRLAQATLLARVGSDLLDLADLVPVEQRHREWGATDALVLSDRLTRAIDRVLVEQLPVTDAVLRWWFQAITTVLTGIKERVAAYLGTKASIRNPLARRLEQSHLLPSRSGTRNPMARQVDFVEPYLRRVAVADVNAAHL